MMMIDYQRWRIDWGIRLPQIGKRMGGARVSVFLVGGCMQWGWMGWNQAKESFACGWIERTEECI